MLSQNSDTNKISNYLQSGSGWTSWDAVRQSLRQKVVCEVRSISFFTPCCSVPFTIWFYMARENLFLWLLLGGCLVSLWPTVCPKWCWDSSEKGLSCCCSAPGSLPSHMTQGEGQWEGGRFSLLRRNYIRKREPTSWLNCPSRVWN